jgi:diguanylate cyclase (GGDEF)-like protein
MNQIEISLLGAIKVKFDGEDVTENLRTKKERAILAYLAEESGRSHTRPIIAEFFWPDRPENYARMNLRQALMGIRKAFGGEKNTTPFLRITEDTVRFLPDTAQLDTVICREHFQTVKNHKHDHLHTCSECINHLNQIIELNRGEFLEDLVLGDVAGFQEWIVFRRERYFRNLLDTLQLLSKVYYKQGDYDQAYWFVWRYVDLAPLEESAHRLLMSLLSLSGRRNAALQQYEFCKSIIEREFGLEPSAETQQLYAKIKNGLPIDLIDTGELGRNKKIKSGSLKKITTDQLYDPITRIPNRPLFMDRLRHTISRMERSRLMAAVFILSFSYPRNSKIPPDSMKEIQQHLVRRLVAVVREGDTVAMLQENEFALILEEIKDPMVIEKITNKIRKAVESQLVVDGKRIELHLSIGSSLFPIDSSDPISLLSKADVSMRIAQQMQPPLF